MIVSIERIHIFKVEKKIIFSIFFFKIQEILCNSNLVIIAMVTLPIRKQLKEKLNHTNLPTNLLLLDLNIRDAPFQYIHITKNMQFFILKKLYVLFPILLLELLPLFLSFSFVRFRIVLLRIILFRDRANFFGLGKHGKLLDSFQKIVVRYRQLVLDHLARIRQLAILLWHGMIVLIVVLHGINHYILV